eukprot:jgi/Mesvir1/28500/Mv15912-RA.1
MAAPINWVEGGPCTEDIVAQLDFASDLIMAIRAGADDFLKEVAAASAARHSWVNQGKPWAGDQVGSAPVREVEAAASTVRANLTTLQTTWRKLAGVLPPPPTPKPAAGASSEQAATCSSPAVVNSQELLQLRQRQRFMPPSQPDECALQATWQRWSAAVTSYTVQNRCQAALSLLSSSCSSLSEILPAGKSKRRRIDGGGTRADARINPDKGLALWTAVLRVQSVAPSSVTIELHRSPHCLCVLPAVHAPPARHNLVNPLPLPGTSNKALPSSGTERPSAEPAAAHAVASAIVPVTKTSSTTPSSGTAPQVPTRSAPKAALVAMAATARCVLVRVTGVLSAMVALAEPGSPRPVSVALFACEEESGASPWGESSHTVFRHLSHVAMDALSFFYEGMAGMRGCGSLQCSPGWALEQLLVWLLAHEDLFARPCVSCGALLSLDRVTGALLPPLLRPYYGVMKEHGDTPRCAPEGGGGGQGAGGGGVAAAAGAAPLALTPGPSQPTASTDAQDGKLPASEPVGAAQKTSPARLQGVLAAFPAYLRIPPFHAQCFIA